MNKKKNNYIYNVNFLLFNCMSYLNDKIINLHKNKK